MADMEPGADPWLDVERRETQYPGGATPNAQNSKTRADTYGIRPDIYEQLSNVITKKVTVDKLLEESRRALEQAAALTAEQAAINEKLIDINEDQKDNVAEQKRLQGLIDGLKSQYDAAVTELDGLNDALRDLNSQIESKIGDAGDITERIKSLNAQTTKLINDQGVLNSLLDQTNSDLKNLTGVAKPLADKISGVSQTLEQRTGAQGTLTTKLNNAATQEQYNALNTRLWGEQGELNKLNTELWNAQSPLNKKLVAFTEMQTKWNDTQTGWNAKQNAINSINNTMWNKQTGWNKTIQAAMDMQAKWNDTQTGWNAKQNQLNRLNGEMWDSQSNLNKKLTAFNAMQVQWNDEQIGWNKKQEQINKALTDSGTANTRAINLLYVQNHGSLYMTDVFKLSGDSRKVLKFDGIRGDLIGCSRGYLNDNGVDVPGSLRFESPGDWEIRARVHMPGWNAIGLGSCQTELTIHVNINGEWQRFSTRSSNSGYAETLNVSTVVHVNAGDYAYVSAWSEKNTANLSGQSNPGPEYTEFSARQLSRDSEIK